MTTSAVKQGDRIGAEIATEPLVKQSAPKAGHGNSNVVFLHLGEPDYTNRDYRTVEPVPTLVRRFAMPLDVFLRAAITEIAGNPNAKTLVSLDTGLSFNVIETFDQVSSLMATGGKDNTLVLNPIRPEIAGKNVDTVLIDNDTLQTFDIALGRGYGSAGCGSAMVWDTKGNEHWVKYGRNWDTNQPYPLDTLISTGRISKNNED